MRRISRETVVCLSGLKFWAKRKTKIWEGTSIAWRIETRRSQKWRRCIPVPFLSHATRKPRIKQGEHCHPFRAESETLLTKIDQRFTYYQVFIALIKFESACTVVVFCVVLEIFKLGASAPMQLPSLAHSPVQCILCVFTDYEGFISSLQSIRDFIFSFTLWQTGLKPKIFINALKDWNWKSFNFNL